MHLSLIHILSELPELEAFHQELAQKGGAVIGINAFTLDGEEGAISDAKDLLSKKGVSYQNIWFAPDSEAGKFTSGLYAFPTTYVVDNNGNIVGEPIVGAVTAPDQIKALQALICLLYTSIFRQNTEVPFVRSWRSWKRSGNAWMIWSILI